MPSVKDKKTGKTKSFPYTAKGKKAAASYKKKMTKPAPKKRGSKKKPCCKACGK